MGSRDIPLNAPPLNPAPTGQHVSFTFDNTFARLPEHFYERLDPTPVTSPRLVKVNVELAQELGLDADALTSEHGIVVLSGNRVADGAGLAAANEALSTFEPQFEAAHSAGMRRKLGLVLEREGDAALGEDLLQCMAANQADFTLTFRRLCDAAAGPEGDAGVRALFANPASYDGWAAGWRRRLEVEVADGQARTAAMRRTNPAFIPRNHLVEAALDAANSRQDFRPFEDLLAVISRPYDERPELERYSAPALPEELVLQTFCGT